MLQFAFNNPLRDFVSLFVCCMKSETQDKIFSCYCFIFFLSVNVQLLPHCKDHRFSIGMTLLICQKSLGTFIKTYSCTSRAAACCLSLCLHSPASIVVAGLL